LIKFTAVSKAPVRDFSSITPAGPVFQSASRSKLHMKTGRRVAYVPAIHEILNQTLLPAAFSHRLQPLFPSLVSLRRSTARGAGYPQHRSQSTYLLVVSQQVRGWGAELSLWHFPLGFHGWRSDRRACKARKARGSDVGKFAGLGFC
jgi:hypothetical protein